MGREEKKGRRGEKRHKEEKRYFMEFNLRKEGKIAKQSKASPQPQHNTLTNPFSLQPASPILPTNHPPYLIDQHQ